MKLWKLQKFASDIVYDMRSRNLLPLAILLVVAIVAVPIVISRGGSEPAPPANDATAASAFELAPENQPAVLAYEPGLRDYEKRLDALRAKDPFKQQYTGTGTVKGAELESALGGTSSGGEGAASPEPGGGTTGSTQELGGGTTGTTKQQKGKKKSAKKRYHHYETDLLVGEVGTQLTRHDDAQELTFLPSEAAPVVIFMGVTPAGNEAIFLVAKNANAVGGDGTCFPDAQVCQLLKLRAGGVEQLAYQLDGKTYEVRVARIKRVATSKPVG
jgi:hypothetical protein